MSFNRGHYYSYILTVIDVLSKYAWAVPLKYKDRSETAGAIAEREWNVQIYKRIWGKSFTTLMCRKS